jgi:hypothetical protein
MTTATATLSITCPPWCTTSAQEHADDLWDFGGRCIHPTDFVSVFDPVGRTPAPLAEPIECSPFSVQLSSTTTPDGTSAQASPLILMDGSEHTLEQVVDLTGTLLSLVTLYCESAPHPTDELVQRLRGVVNIASAALPSEMNQ